MNDTGPMREAFVHEAVLSMGPEADLGAPGAAITVHGPGGASTRWRLRDGQPSVVSAQGQDHAQRLVDS